MPGIFPQVEIFAHTFDNGILMHFLACAIITILFPGYFALSQIPTYFQVGMCRHPFITPHHEVANFALTSTTI